MATTSYKDFMKVCETLGLEPLKIKSGVMYRGKANGVYCRIPIHIHANGRDIPTGLFLKYVKTIGFQKIDDYYDYLRTI